QDAAGDAGSAAAAGAGGQAAGAAGRHRRWPPSRPAAGAGRAAAAAGGAGGGGGGGGAAAVRGQPAGAGLPQPAGPGGAPMTPFGACVIKEFRLLRRDLHSLALLFLMPLAFVLVMSLAMQEQFAARAGKQVAVLVQDEDGGAAARQLQERIRASAAFRLTPAGEGGVDAALAA